MSRASSWRRVYHSIWSGFAIVAGDDVGDEPAEERQDEPHGEGDERSRRGAAEHDRAERRERQPEADVDDAEEIPGQHAHDVVVGRHDPQSQDADAPDEEGDRARG